MRKDDENERTAITHEGYALARKGFLESIRAVHPQQQAGFPHLPFSLSRHRCTLCRALALSFPRVYQSCNSQGCKSKKSDSLSSAFTLLFSKGEVRMNKPRWLYFSEETKCVTSGVNRG